MTAMRIPAFSSTATSRPTSPDAAAPAAWASGVTLQARCSACIAI